MEKPLLSTAAASDHSAFALCNLLLLMPLLPVTSTSELDYAFADSALLVQVADAADASVLIAHIGTSSINQLLKHAAAEAVQDEALADTIESLGWLVAELDAVAEVARKVAGACHRRTYGHVPTGDATIPVVKP